MSRLTEIVNNHEQLDHLLAILKHHGVNAEFVTASLLNEFERMNEEGQDEDKSSDNEQHEPEDTSEIFEDLAQFYARF